MTERAHTSRSGTATTLEGPTLPCEVDTPGSGSTDALSQTRIHNNYN